MKGGGLSRWRLGAVVVSLKPLLVQLGFVKAAVGAAALAAPRLDSASRGCAAAAKGTTAKAGAGPVAAASASATLGVLGCTTAALGRVVGGLAGHGVLLGLAWMGLDPVGTAP